MLFMIPDKHFVTTDCVIFIKEKIVLIKRLNPPFKGEYALPGGFVDENEVVADACRREVMEETNIQVTDLKLVGIYSKPKRDPRGFVITIAYLANSDGVGLKAGDDAQEVELLENPLEKKLAFDHKQIISDAIALRNSFI